MEINKNILKAAGISASVLGFSLAADHPAKAEENKQDPPNILWFFIEDMNPLLGCYGDTLASTPHMDRLAENGVVFNNAFVPAPVSSPCRSGIITGSRPTTLGLHNHRSSRNEDEIHLPGYVQTLPEIFREAGYFTYNKGKEDYNFEYEMSDLYSSVDQDVKDHWSQREDDQPFFAQIQLRGGKYVHNHQAFSNRKWRMDPEKAVQTLPENYPRHEIIKKHWAWHYDAVKLTDDAIGRVLNELKQDGLLENTIIFCFSDHGCYLPRDKQFAYEGGLHVPLIVSYFGDEDYLPSGKRRDDLVNLIDVSASSLGLAGLEVPGWFESRDLFARDHQEREYVISSKDRMDFTIDRVRSVRTKHFHYIRNFMTDRPYMQPQYRDPRKDFMKLMRRKHKKNELAPTIDWFYDDYRPAEELYDLRKDPDELRSVADDPQYRKQLEKMRKILYSWVEQTDDRGQYLEGSDGLQWLNKRDMWTGLVRNPEYDRLRIPYYEIPSHVEAEMPRAVKGLKYQITTDGDHGFETLVPTEDGGYELLVPGFPNREKGRSTGHPYSAGEKVYEMYGAEKDEYLEYRVKVPDHGKYIIQFRLASAHKDASIHIQAGKEKIGTLKIPYTGGNRNWKTQQTTVELDKGITHLRFVFDGPGEDLVHLNWFRIYKPYNKWWQ